MGRNRSLDEFGAPPPEGDEQGDDDRAASSTPGDDAVEPLDATYAWTPGAGRCDACGEPADERWRDGDDLVCPGCKTW